MTDRFLLPLRGLLLALIGVAAISMPARAAEPSAVIAVVSDIHFNPFAAPGLAPGLVLSEPKEWPRIFRLCERADFSARGEDTNQALLASALAALSESAAVVPISLSCQAIFWCTASKRSQRKCSGASPTSSVVKELASKTALYVADVLRATLPGRPILIALGNINSECGDYRLEPRGAFLASLRDTTRDLAGPDRVAGDFAQTYEAGGYYAMQHPAVAGTTILVNDVLWSTNYRDACGTQGMRAAEAMMAWLERQLSEARAAGRRVWLVHHIPVGIDAFATLHISGESTARRA